MTPPTDDPDAWARVGQLITSRRIELGYRRREDLVAANAGISLRTLGDIEGGRKTRYHANTIATVETALRWKAGSINAILAGGEPTLVGSPAVNARDAGTVGSTLNPPMIAQELATDEVLISIMRREDLTEAQKARIIRTLIGEQERFARERADALIRAELSTDE